MRLRNKKTGEVVKLVGLSVYHDRLFYELEDEKGIFKREINSLSELNGEWEDYKPKTNSRFRLVKDLPTFKAGQEFHLSPKGNLVLNDGKFGICAYAKQTLEKFPNILEDWFEPIDDGDINVTNIKPKEPLIKNEEIRKAVRAWAEANSITQVNHDAGWNAFRCTDFVIAFDYDFDWHDGLKNTESYTIDELCGEEEE